MEQELMEMKHSNRIPDGNDPKMAELMSNYREL